jgi:DNA-binding transcriptional MerR regulator
MSDGLSIGEAAKQTGLSIHTLRFYEREGLLLSQTIARSSSGHRRFNHEEVNWLQKCTKLRASGMPLTKIRHYIELVREGPGNEQQRLGLLREQQRMIENQLAELGECLHEIHRKVAIYEQRISESKPI